MERMSDDWSTKKLYSNKPEGLRLVAKEALVRRSRAELETDGSERLEEASPE
jgi:hypothetical protein